jgi:hypothetical protein
MSPEAAPRPFRSIGSEAKVLGRFPIIKFFCGVWRIYNNINMLYSAKALRCMGVLRCIGSAGVQHTPQANCGV